MSVMRIARTLFVVSMIGASCREPNPDWDPERQAMTAPGEGTSEATFEGTTEDASGDGTTSVLECEAHETPCDDACVDLRSNPDHCGACFEWCRPPNRQCEDGECVR
jgi:hypothetical protein